VIKNHVLKSTPCTKGCFSLDTIAGSSSSSIGDQSVGGWMCRYEIASNKLDVVQCHN